MDCVVGVGSVCKIMASWSQTARSSLYYDRVGVVCTNQRENSWRWFECWEIYIHVPTSVLRTIPQQCLPSWNCMNRYLMGDEIIIPTDGGTTVLLLPTTIGNCCWWVMVGHNLVYLWQNQRFHPGSTNRKSIIGLLEFTTRWLDRKRNWLMIWCRLNVWTELKPI